jgi:hypothetical protein
MAWKEEMGRYWKSGMEKGINAYDTYPTFTVIFAYKPEVHRHPEENLNFPGTDFVMKSSLKTIRFSSSKTNWAPTVQGQLCDLKQLIYEIRKVCDTFRKLTLVPATDSPQVSKPRY